VWKTRRCVGVFDSDSYSESLLDLKKLRLKLKAKVVLRSSSSTVIVKIESGSCLVRASFHLLYIKCSFLSPMRVYIN